MSSTQVVKSSILSGAYQTVKQPSLTNISAKVTTSTNQTSNLTRSRKSLSGRVGQIGTQSLAATGQKQST